MRPKPSAKTASCDGRDDPERALHAESPVQENEESCRASKDSGDLREQVRLRVAQLQRQRMLGRVEAEQALASPWTTAGAVTISVPSVAGRRTRVIHDGPGEIA